MILPVTTQHESNMAYYGSMPDDEIMLRIKEATGVWMQLLLTDAHPDYIQGHYDCLSYWQQVRDDLETIAKKRKLIP